MSSDIVQCMNCAGFTYFDDLEEETGIWADLMHTLRGFNLDTPLYTCPKCGSYGCTEDEDGEVLFTYVEDGGAEGSDAMDILCPNCGEPFPVAEVGEVGDVGDYQQCPGCSCVTPSDDWEHVTGPYGEG